MIDAVGKAETGSEKAGGGPCAAHVLFCFRAGNPSPQSLDGNLTVFFICFRFKSQILNTLQKMSGIVGEESAAQSGSAFGQGGQQKRAIGDAFGTGNVYCKRTGERDSFGLYGRVNAGHRIGSVSTHFVSPLCFLIFRV